VNLRRFSTATVALLVAALALPAADDPYGDPLPDGARLRLGTARMRHPTTVTPNALTPDGKFLVGGGSRGLTYVDVTTGKVAREVGPFEGVFGNLVAFSKDGKRAVATEFSGVWVCATDTAKVLAKVSRAVPSGPAGVSLAADGRRMAVGGVRSFDEKAKDPLPTAIVWDVDGDRELSRVRASQNNTVYVALSPDGTRLATWGIHSEPDRKDPPRPEGDPNRLVQFWDATTGKEAARVRVPSRYTPFAVAFSPDGSLAAVAGGEGAIHLLDPATGAEKGMLLGRSGQGRVLAFGSDGKTLAAGGEDGSVQRWTVPDGKPLGTTEPPDYPYSPRGIVFPDNDRAVAWGPDKSASLVWEVPSGMLLSPAGGHRDAITGVAVAGGKEIITTGAAGTVIRWDLATGKELGRVALKRPARGFAPDVVTGEVRVSPDGTRAIAADGAGGIGIHDLPSGLQRFAIPADFVRDGTTAFSADGSKLLIATRTTDARKYPARVTVWDAATGRKLGAVELPGLQSAAAALSPDGTTLVTVGLRTDAKNPNRAKDFVVTGWELATGKKLGEYIEPGGFGMPGVAVAGDNRLAVVIAPRGRAVVVDVVTGKAVRELDLGKRQADAPPVISPDGKTVAIPATREPSSDGMYAVLLLDIESGRLTKTLGGLRTAPTALAFSPDGKALVTGSRDTTALVWDVAP
jgi:WD40 repeat protein